MQDSSLREGKPYNLLLYRWHQKPYFPKVHRSPALHCTSLEEIPVKELKSQLPH
jgi:hypothetical protein